MRMSMKKSYTMQSKKEKKKLLEEKGIHQIVKENEEQTLALQTELNENPEYSLVVDPTDKYSMSETQKAFISINDIRVCPF